MKHKIISSSKRTVEPVIEEKLHGLSKDTLDTAQKNGKLFGKRDLPSLKGDCLSNYIDDIKAKKKDFFGFETDKAICRTSGGIGKKDDSVNARTNSAKEEYFLCAHESTQS